MAGEIIRRPDLESAECSYPSYVGTKIYKWLAKPNIAGRIYYQDFHSDINAQVGRNQAALADINETVVASNSDTWSASEVRARIKMSYAERITGYNDDESADLYMGRLAKRAYFNKIETLCAGQLFESTGAIDGTSDPVSAIDTNVSLLRDLGVGRIGLVICNKNKVSLKANSTISDRMKSTGLGAYDLKEIRNIGDMNLAAALGVDEILTMKDAIGYAGVSGADKDCCALVILPEENEDPTEVVQLGRVIYYTFSDSEDDRFCMESWVDAVHDANVVDCKGLVQLKEFNPELRKTIRIFNNNADSDSASL